MKEDKKTRNQNIEMKETNGREESGREERRGEGRGITPGYDTVPVAREKTHRLAAHCNMVSSKAAIHKGSGTKLKQGKAH